MFTKDNAKPFTPHSQAASLSLTNFGLKDFARNNQELSISAAPKHSAPGLASYANLFAFYAKKFANNAIKFHSPFQQILAKILLNASLAKRIRHKHISHTQ